MPLEIIFYTASFVGIYFSIFLLITLFENRKNLSREPSQKEFPELTVLIPCYNEEKSLAPTVRSVLNADYPADKLNVMIIDDGSSDNTYGIGLQLAKRHQNVEIYHKENGGKYTALNYGLKKIKTELVATLDADCFIDEKSLSRITAYFEDKETDAVTSSVKVYKPQTIWQYFQNTLYLFVLLLRKTFSFFGSVKVTPGPLSVFRREVFEKVGYYRHGHQTEDIEMGLRLQENNCQVKHALDSYVYTKTPTTFKALYHQRVRWAYGGIKNLWDYRHLFGPQHGNLGMLVLPANLVSFIAFPLSISIVLYRLISHGLRYLHSWSAVGFSGDALLSFLPSFSFSVPSPLIMIGAVQITLTLIFILFSKKLTRDNSKIGRSLLFAALFSFPLLSLYLISAFYRIISNQTVKW